MIPNETFFIPFLFVLAVVFGVLRISDIFRNPAVEMVISLAIAYFAATYEPFVSVLFTYLPNVTWFFIAIFFILFLLEAFGLRKAGADYEEKAITTGVILLVLFGIGVSGLEGLKVEIPFVGGGENLAFLSGIILLVLLFWYVYKSGPSEKVRG